MLFIMLLTCSVWEYYRNLPAQSTNFTWLAHVHPQKRPFQYWGHTTTTEGALGSHNPQIASEISVTLLFCTLTRLPNALNAKMPSKEHELWLPVIMWIWYFFSNLQIQRQYYSYTDWLVLNNKQLTPSIVRWYSTKIPGVRFPTFGNYAIMLSRLF